MTGQDIAEVTKFLWTLREMHFVDRDPTRCFHRRVPSSKKHKVMLIPLSNQVAHCKTCEDDHHQGLFNDTSCLSVQSVSLCVP